MEGVGSIQAKEPQNPPNLRQDLHQHPAPPQLKALKPFPKIAAIAPILGNYEVHGDNELHILNCQLEIQFKTQSEFSCFPMINWLHSKID